MELIEAIKGRRSIRKFKKEPIPKGVVERILEAAAWAPSGMNQQNWHFYVLTGEKKEGLGQIIVKGFDEASREKIVELFSEKMANFIGEFFKTLGGAPVVVVAYSSTGQESESIQTQSVAAAIQNLLLTAYAEGLGSCWMAGPQKVENKISEFLGVEGKRLIAVIPLGYPDQAPPTPPRKEGRITWIGF